MKLQCGCRRSFMDSQGKATMRMFDGINGLNCKCPEHGWTIQVVDKQTYRFIKRLTNFFGVW